MTSQTWSLVRRLAASVLVALGLTAAGLGAAAEINVLGTPSS